MKKLIDDKGRLFGKINIIDLMVVIAIFILIPGFYVGQKLMREFYDGVKLYEPRKDLSFYVVERPCPNCGAPHWIDIEKGKPLSDVLPYKTKCRYCGKNFPHELPPCGL